MNGDSRTFFKLLRFYVNDELEDARLNMLKDLFKKNDFYKLIFNLVTNCKELLPENSSTSQGYHSICYSDLDKMLLNILGGCYSRDEAEFFLTCIGQPIGILHYKLSELIDNAHVDTNDATLLSEVNVLSNTVLFNSYMNSKLLNENSSSFPNFIPSLQKSIQNVKNSLRFMFMSSMRKKHVFVPALGLAVAVLFILMSTFQTSRLTHYIHTDKIPYPFETSQLRSGIESPPDELYDYFQMTFNSGASDYVIKNYTGAIRTWESLLPIANKWQENKWEEAATILNNFYFYLGITYLTLGKESKLKYKSYKSFHKAVYYLNKALSFSIQMQNSNVDRNRYYLGFAFVFCEQYQNAFIQLDKIPKNSKFGRDASVLLQRYKNKF